MLSAVIAVWKLGSSCSMPKLVLESSWKRLKSAAVEAATDARTSNTRCNQGSSTDLPMDFTTKRNKGNAFLHFHAFLTRCESVAWRVWSELERQTEPRYGDCRWKHTNQTRVYVTCQDLLATLREEYRHREPPRDNRQLSQQRARWFVKSCDIMLTRGVASSKPQQWNIRALTIAEASGNWHKAQDSKGRTKFNASIVSIRNTDNAIAVSSCDNRAKSTWTFPGWDDNNQVAISQILMLGTWLNA